MVPLEKMKCMNKDYFDHSRKVMLYRPDHALEALRTSGRARRRLSSCQPYRGRLRIDRLGWWVSGNPSSPFLNGPLRKLADLPSVHAASSGLCVLYLSCSKKPFPKTERLRFS